ncbi:MAG: hypothetical protein GXP32_03245 [Kiritimatiellaeota bacterium]|nr:hypothetical protein [Kiritimatiellota bacterium]
MSTAYIRYPGSPRFGQLSAIVNALVNEKYDSVVSLDALGLPDESTKHYDSVKAKYNTLYSALNVSGVHLPEVSGNKIVMKAIKPYYFRGALIKRA